MSFLTLKLSALEAVTAVLQLFSKEKASTELLYHAAVHCAESALMKV